MIANIELPKLDALTKTGRDAYLATLGAIVVAQAETAKAIDALVQEGSRVDARRATAMENAIDRAKSTLRTRRDAIVERVRRTPTRDEVRALAASVQALSSKVDLLVAQLETAQPETTETTEQSDA